MRLPHIRPRAVCGYHTSALSIQHWFFALVLYEVTTRVHYPYSTGWGALTGLYPTVVQVWCLGLITRAGIASSPGHTPVF